MPFEPIVPNGQHLGTSRNVDGAVTGHLFDNETNALMGIAAWRWVDPSPGDPGPPGTDCPRDLTPEEQELASTIASLIVIGVYIGVDAAVPHLKRWWSRKLSPAIRAVWQHAKFASRAHRQKARPARDAATQPLPAAACAEMALAIPVSELQMSRSEWNQRFRAVLAADAFSDEQRRLLKNAHIVDEQPDEGHAPSACLTPNSLVARVQLVVERNPSLLDSELRAALVASVRATLDGVDRQKSVERANQPGHRRLSEG